ncbi:MAG: type IV pilus assembly protein PilM [Methylococcaceae bacterium]|jgi:type IV pilus assembly protein PilM
MFSLAAKKPVLLGIDISNTSVKVVELASVETGFDVRGYAVTAIPSVDAGSEIKNDSRIEAIGSAVRKAVKQSGTRLTRAAAAVSGSSVISRTLQVSSTLNEDEIEAQIELEAEQYIPYPVDEVSFDFSIQGPSSQPGMIDVLVVASRKAFVEDRAAALEWAGLKAEIIDVDSFAMEAAYTRTRAKAHDTSADCYAIIDIGSMATTLNVINRRQVVFTREQGIGGRQLTEEIQRRFGLSFEDAERAKKYGGMPSQYEDEVLRPFVTLLGQQISRSLHFFRSSQPQSALNHLVLAGGCAGLPGLEAVLQETEGAEITVVNPFVNMSIAARLSRQNLAKDAPSLLTATGLALRSFE